MKNKDVLKLLSDSQDNGVLIKEYSEDDFISRLIIKNLSNNTDKNQDVDLEALLADLSYAKEQILRAQMAIQKEVSKIAVAREEAERDFEVPVVRIGYGFKTIKVRATSQEEANQIALDEAGNEEFSEKSSEYKLEE